MDCKKSKDSTEFIVSMDNLPDVTLLEIFANLDFIDLCKCSQVCRLWYRLTQSLSLKKNIVIASSLKPRQWPLLVKHHFHKHLLSFEYRNTTPSCLTLVKKHTFFKMQAKCPELKKLILVSCCLNYVTLEDMPASLQYLSVRKSEINPYHFFSACPQYYVPHLTCLDVGAVSNFLTSEDLHIFTHLKNLRCLYLEGCFRINNGGIESIIEVLKHLEVLDVEGTDISNEGVRIIITHGMMLKDLFLGYLHINDEAFHDMHMNRFLALQTLCVKSTYVTAATVQKFSKCKGKQMNFISSYDEFGNFIDMPEKSVVDFFVSCNHYLTHSCSF